MMSRMVALLLTSKERIYLLAIVAGMLISAFLETASIGVVIPLMGMVFDGSIITRYPLVSYLCSMAGIGTQQEMVFFAAAGLVAIFVLKNIFLFFLSYFQVSFFGDLQVRCSTDLLKSYLYKPYEYYFEKNSAELQKNITYAVPQVIGNFLQAACMLISESLVTVGIVGLLMWVDMKSAVMSAVFMGGGGACVYLGVRKRVKEYANGTDRSLAEIIKIAQHSFGSIKETKILQVENKFIGDLHKTCISYNKNSKKYQVLNQVPRLVIEVMAIIGILAIVLINAMKQDASSADIIAVLAVFSMAIFKIMPALNRIVVYVNTIRFSAIAFQNIKEDLMEAQREGPRKKNVLREGKRTLQDIKIENISYRYPRNENFIINNCSLTIPRGAKVGIVGESGAGKTTLVDLILGLLQPESGNIVFGEEMIHNDIEKWQAQIGYIPQNVYLFDGTIAENIAVISDDEEIDEERLYEVIKIAQLERFINELPLGVHNPVGEQGIRLSGGQKQRIGIARAIYKNPSILILDESTSALDTETENRFMEAVIDFSAEKTLIIIAHRLTTIEKCDFVYRVSNGNVVLE